MTLEQAYKKVHMMDEVLNSDILNDEEYASVAKRRFKLMGLIGLEEQRQKQLATKQPKYLSDWVIGFLDSYVMQGTSFTTLPVNKQMYSGVSTDTSHSGTVVLSSRLL